LNFNLNGDLDLRLLSGFVPDLDARGPAQINAVFEGPWTAARHRQSTYRKRASAGHRFSHWIERHQWRSDFDASRLFFEM